MRFLIYVFGIWLVFTVFVTVFSLSARKDDVRSLPKFAWVLLCLFVPFVGGLLYLAFGRPLPTPDDYSGRRGATRTVAPDDDPDFLRRLAKRLKDEAPSADNPDAGNQKSKNDEEDRPKGGDLPNV